MAQWRLQSPDNFPPAFHMAIRQPLGNHLIERTATKAAAQAMQKRWRLFRFCLRGYASTPSGQWEPMFDRQTFITHNHDANRWELRMTVRESAASILASTKVLTNNS